MGLPLPNQEDSECPAGSSFKSFVVQTDGETNYALLSTGCGFRRSDRAGEWLLPGVEIDEIAAVSGREVWALAFAENPRDGRVLFRIEDGAWATKVDHDFGGPLLGLIGPDQSWPAEQPLRVLVHTAESVWVLQPDGSSWIELWSRDQIETLEAFTTHRLQIEFLVAHHEMVVTGVRLEPTSDDAVGAKGWLISPEGRPTYFVETEPRFEFLDKPWLVEMDDDRRGLVGVTSSRGWEVFGIPDDPAAQPEYLADGPGMFVSSVEYFEERLWVASDKGLAYRTLPKAKSREPRLIYGEPVKAVGVLGDVVFFFTGNGRDQVCWVRFEKLPWGRQPAPPECMRASFINEAYDPLDVVLHRDEAWILEETGLYYFDVEGKIDLELNAISGWLLGRLEILLLPSLSPNGASYSIGSPQAPELALEDLCISIKKRSGAIGATPCDLQDFGKENNPRHGSGDITESNEDRLTLSFGLSEVRTTTRDAVGNVSSEDRLILAIPFETWLAVVASGIAPGLLGLFVLFLALLFRFWIVVLMSPVIRNPLFSWMSTIALMVPLLRQRLLRHYVSNLDESIDGWEGEPCAAGEKYLDDGKKFHLVLAERNHDDKQVHGLIRALVNQGAIKEERETAKKERETAKKEREANKKTLYVPVFLDLDTGRENLSITDRIAEAFAEYGGLSDRELVEFLIRRRGFHYCFLLTADSCRKDDLKHFIMQQHVGNRCLVILYPPRSVASEDSRNCNKSSDSKGLGGCNKPGEASNDSGSCDKSGEGSKHLGSCDKPGEAGNDSGSCSDKPGEASKNSESRDRWTWSDPDLREWAKRDWLRISEATRGGEPVRCQALSVAADMDPYPRSPRAQPVDSADH